MRGDALPATERRPFSCFRIFLYSNIVLIVTHVRQFKAALFQALAHPTRLQILEVLRDGELSVSAIRSKVARDQANISQHLSLLRLRGLVVNRKEGNQVFYSVRDRLMIEVLDLMRRYFHSHLSEALGMLAEMESQAK